MTTIVHSTCTPVFVDSTGTHESASSQPLSSFRHVPALVLLGDPGMGKTTALKSESQAIGDSGHFVSARDFLTFDLETQPEFERKTLFIDGLDEIRCGSGDSRNPLDRIRNRLRKLGNPRFRIACRPADWLSKSDRIHLARVSPDSELMVLNLDPLDEASCEEFLKSHGVSDCKKFVADARARNAQGLLANPQCLEMLIKRVGAEGGWPTGRFDLFEGACRQLAMEWNAEHEAVTERPTEERLLEAAGYLCAMLLTTGNSGLKVNSSEPIEGALSLSACVNLPSETLKFATATGLFRSINGDQFEPIHRHVAEFLGGRFLANLVDQGHPAKRILTLLIGQDGGVVSSLRGIAAWFATQCPPARLDLIALDPVGVGHYGDLGEFTPSEKQKYLVFLRKYFAQLHSIWSGRTAFLPLASPDMEPHIAELLANPNPDSSDCRIAELLLSLIPDSTRQTTLGERLLAVAVDQKWSGYANQLALRAYIKSGPESEEKSRRLHELLIRISRGDLFDPEYELRGELLSCLYPARVGATQVWEHFLPGRVAIIGGSYWRFWTEDLIRGSDAADIQRLLNEFCERANELLPIADSNGFRGLQVRMLDRGLQLCGDRVSPARLHRWLSTGCLSRRLSPIHEDESSDRIRTWIEERPALQLELSLECLATTERTSWSSHDFHGFRECMFNAEPPTEFAQWCLSRIAQFAESDPQISRRLVNAAIGLHTAGGTGFDLPRAELLSAVHGNHELQELVEKHWGQRESDQLRDGVRGHQIDQPAIDPAKVKWLELVRAHVGDLNNNVAPPVILHDLGRAAFGLLGHHSLRHSTVAEKLSDLLDCEPELLQAARSALRGAPFRSDVPDVSAAIELFAQSKISMLNFAVLAGMGDLARNRPSKLDEFTEEQIRSIVAIQFFTSTGAGEDPQWFSDWIKSRGDLIGDVLARCALAEIRSQSGYIESIRRLAFDQRYRKLSCSIALRLLKAFPIRCNLDQIRVLDHLLLAALAHSDPTSLEALIAKKLSNKSMLPAPRVHWLAAGVVINPDVYIHQIQSHVRNKHSHTKQLVNFLEPREAFPELRDRFGPRSARIFVELIGTEFGPRQNCGWVGYEANASELLRELTAIMSMNPSECATHSLRQLAANPELSAWKSQFEFALGEQLILRRDSIHRFPSVAAVDDALRNRSPANVADLAALVDEKLQSLADQIRTSNTDDWHQYWNENPNFEPTPKEEIRCRDALLSDLQKLLPAGVQAEPEGRYASETRADIKVGFEEFQVPVEIKRQMHRDLWSSLHEQLIAKYTSDPSAGGFGIYLVFWFGPKFHLRPAPDGTSPVTAEELHSQLTATLSEDESLKVTVRVIDVSWPVRPNP